MLHDQIVTMFCQQARALCGQIDKAAAWCSEQGKSEADLLESRLAPDMFPLARQFDAVVAQMLQPLRRFTGQDIADPAAASGSLAAYRDRIKAAIETAQSIAPATIDAAAHTMIALDLPNGMAFDLTGDDYARDWGVPQFYFHTITAYAILRMNGVPLGKGDYVPHMGRHARASIG